MVSWTARRSRKQFRREGQPLAPNTDVAGKNVYAFRRFVPAQYPPLRVFKGRAIRHEGSYEPIELKSIAAFSRFLGAQYPPLRVFKGRIIRREGLYDPAKDLQLPDRLWRFLRAQYPPLRVFKGRHFRQYGQEPQWLKYTEEMHGSYRVADTTLEQYEIYIGEDANPDFSAAPAGTSASLPFSQGITPPGAGDTDFRATVRFRNRHNLISLNQYFRSFIVDSNGDLVLPDPSAPQDVALYNVAGLYVRVDATYYRHEDGENAADTWFLYWTDTGVDPNPALDTPIEIAIAPFGPFAQLRYLLGPFTGGEDIRVLVRVERAGDESTNVTVSQIDVPAKPATPGGRSFGGEEYEYR